MNQSILVGMNARYPAPNPSHRPRDGRTLCEEIEFAGEQRFQSIQFALREQDGFASVLGDVKSLRPIMDGLDIMPVAELVLRIGSNGLTQSGSSPIDIYRTQVEPIVTAGCRCVHWHLVPASPLQSCDEQRRLEETLTTQLALGVRLSNDFDLRFGFEHNDRKLGLFSDPERCAAVLDVIDGLWFVWDFNHTSSDDLAGFISLGARTSMVHVSDTSLPTTNQHLPLGHGTVDINQYCRRLISTGFRGPAILEIGGLPQSGGYGQDTDAQLAISRDILARSIQSALIDCGQ